MIIERKEREKDVMKDKKSAASRKQSEKLEMGPGFFVQVRKSHIVSEGYWKNARGKNFDIVHRSRIWIRNTMLDWNCTRNRYSSCTNLQKISKLFPQNTF
jgi:hypothetical protein